MREKCWHGGAAVHTIRALASGSALEMRSTTDWASSLVMSPRWTNQGVRAFMTLQHALSISHDSAKRGVPNSSWTMWCGAPTPSNAASTMMSQPLGFLTVPALPRQPLLWFAGLTSTNNGSAVVAACDGRSRPSLAVAPSSQRPPGLGRGCGQTGGFGSVVGHDQRPQSPASWMATPHQATGQQAEPWP